MKNSKYIESYFINEYECGIFCVTFNLTERWIGYHAYCETQYIFGEGVQDETQEEWEARIQDIEEFLPKGKSYLPTVIQNKEQVQFYYIPFEIISREKELNYEKE